MSVVQPLPFGGSAADAMRFEGKGASPGTSGGGHADGRIRFVDTEMS